jgi:subtilisin family serine protease
VQNQPYLGLTGKGVIIAFLDTGIDYTQKVFQYEDKTTKIKFIWDQTLPYSGANDVNYGQVFSESQINSALQSNDPHSLIPHIDTDGHGTYLASVAAGRQVEDFLGAAPDADIIAVKLRSINPYYADMYFIENPELTFQSTDIMIAIDFIKNKAFELNKPVIYCIAIGGSFGAHIGQNKIERYMNIISAESGNVFCVGVGNDGNKRHHTSGHINKTGEKVTFGVNVLQPNQNFGLATWFAAWDRMSIQIKSPSGELLDKIPSEIGIVYSKKLVFEDSIVTVINNLSSNRCIITNIEKGTQGIWEFSLIGEQITSGDFHSWMQVVGLTNPNVEYLTPDPYYTAVIPSTSTSSIGSTAYDMKTDSLSINSSWGPTSLPRITPDFAAPGVNVGGIFPWGYGVMSGTSVSAAITSGACALLMQWAEEELGTTLNSNQIRPLLIDGCTREPGTEYPSAQWGYGKLNLFQTFYHIR